MNANKANQSTTRRIVLDALFAALFIVFSSVWPFTTKLGIIEISFLVSFPILLAALLFSAGDAILVALVGSFVEQLISPYGLAPNAPLWMAPVVLQAVVLGVGFFLLSKKNAVWNENGKLSVFVLLVVLIGELVLSVCNTAALYLDGWLYAYPVKALHLMVLPKLANCGVRTVVSLILVYTLTPKLKKLIRGSL